jgi:hypothetical protein
MTLHAKILLFQMCVCYLNMVGLTFVCVKCHNIHIFIVYNNLGMQNKKLMNLNDYVHLI